MAIEVSWADLEDKDAALKRLLAEGVVVGLTTVVRVLAAATDVDELVCKLEETLTVAAEVTP
jgi:hypothetical protein